jgi:hypothetical protein
VSAFLTVGFPPIIEFSNKPGSALSRETSLAFSFASRSYFSRNIKFAADFPELDSRLTAPELAEYDFQQAAMVTDLISSGDKKYVTRKRPRP